jgi:uracil-DNA glycosylase
LVLFDQLLFITFLKEFICTVITKSELNDSWYEVLKSEFSSSYMADLSIFLEKEFFDYAVFPPKQLVFECFNRTPESKVKALILGQDPYHGINQAHGLSFSVQGAQRMPPSLRNILKELRFEYESLTMSSGDLSSWADQGVLLMNSTLTVRQSEPGSHQNMGWERFTDAVVEHLSNEREDIVFILWGKFAQSKARLIDQTKHLVLMAPHPSPFSAHKGFFGCGHFLKANEYLIEKGYDPIDWNIY